MQTNRSLKFSQFQQLSEIEKKALLTPKLKEKNQNIICFVLTYDKTLENVKKIINKHWRSLEIDRNLMTSFEQEQTIEYRRNKNLGDLIGSKKILDNKVKQELQ